MECKIITEIEMASRSYSWKLIVTIVWCFLLTTLTSTTTIQPTLILHQDYFNNLLPDLPAAARAWSALNI